MKHRISLYGLTLAATLIAVACGGSGGSTNTGGGGGSGDGNTGGGAAVSAGALSGTAATGAAIAGGTVSAVCAVGTGSATTGNDGKYTLNLSNITLPCLIRVTDPATGETLYSAAESGSSVVNITPITDLVTANALGGDLATAFSGFNASNAANLTVAKLATAKALVKSALQNAIPDADIGSDDPMKTAFKAAQGDGEGDAHDKKLDALMSALAASGKKINDLRTPMQTATTGASGASSITTIVGTAATGMAGCPWARSGKFHMISTRRAVNFYTIDYSNSSIAIGFGASRSFTISTTEKCVFTTTAITSLDSQTTYRISSSGVIGWSTHSGVGASPSKALLAYGFAIPVQDIPLVDLTGNWELLQLSGEWTTTPLASTNFIASPLGVGGGGNPPVGGTAPKYWHEVPNKLTAQIAQSATNDTLLYTIQTCTGSATVCPAISGVISHLKPSLTRDRFNATRPNDPFQLSNYSVFFYKTLNGDWMLISDDGSIGIKRAVKLALPQKASTLTAWSIISQDTGVDSIFLDQFIVTAVNESTRSYTRTRASDNRVDTINLDTPSKGLFSRPAGADPVATPAITGIMGKGWSVSATTNTDPLTGPVFFGISINK